MRGSSDVVPTKKELFWCMYDYGTGELLLRIRARGADEIVAKYPELDVLEGDPPWFEPEEARDFDRFPEYDIDAEPAGALKELAALKRAARDKQHYYAELRQGGNVLRRRIWAASIADIESRYPQLDVMPMVVAPPDAWFLGQSEIDVPDDFWSTLERRTRATSH